VKGLQKVRASVCRTVGLEQKFDFAKAMTKSKDRLTSSGLLCVQIPVALAQRLKGPVDRETYELDLCRYAQSLP